MQAVPLPKNAIRSIAGQDSNAPPASNLEANLTNAETQIEVGSTKDTIGKAVSTGSSKIDCEKEAARFNLEIQAAISEQAAKLFEAHADLLSGQWRDTFDRIALILDQATALRQTASELAEQQAEGLRQMARALRGS